MMGRRSQQETPSHKTTRQDWQEIGQTLREALDEVGHAARPRPHKSFWREGLSWAVALAASAAVLARSFQVAQTSLRTQDATPDKALPAKDEARHAAGNGTTAAPTTQSEVRPTASAESTCDEPTATNKKASGERAVVSGGMALVKELYKRFNDDEGFTRAAALAFWGILSLVPLMLFALASLGFVIHNPQQAADYVQQFIAQLVPGRQAAQAANDIIQQTHVAASAEGLRHGRWWAAIGGLLSLIWTALGLLVNASGPMNAAWDVKETRSFVRLRLICLGVFACAGLFFLLSLLLSSGPNIVHSLHIPWLGLPQPAPFWLTALFEILAVILNIGMFTLIFRFLPNTPVTWKAAAFGGVITGVLLELFKKGFAIYLTHFGNYNKLYGTLGGIVLLITWIYYGCVVLLLGATICKMYHEHKEEGGVVCRPRRTSPIASNNRR